MFQTEWPSSLQKPSDKSSLGIPEKKKGCKIKAVFLDFQVPVPGSPENHARWNVLLINIIDKQLHGDLKFVFGDKTFD